MKENKLTDLSMDFAVEIVNLVKQLKADHETIVSNQIGRCGTSIGANIHEAQCESLSAKCTALRVLLAASCKTAKENQK